MSTRTVAEIAVMADTKQAREEIKKLADALGKSTAEIEKQVKDVQLLGNKWDELSKSMVGLQLHDAFKRVSDSAKELTGGVLDLNMAFAGYKVAGPWGAAVGAVGGALLESTKLTKMFNFEIDELEKKAAKHARTLMPELTSELWKQADAWQAQVIRMAAVPGALAKMYVEYAKLQPLLKKVREEIQTYDSAPARVNRGLRAGAAGLQDFLGDATTRFLGVSSWGKLQYKKSGGGGGFDDEATGLGVSIAGSIGNYDYLQAMQDNEDARRRSALSSQIRTSADLGGYAGLQSQVDAFQRGEFGRRNAEAYSNFAAGQQQSFLEKTFGPVDQFDIYARGFQALSGAVGASLGAWIDGSMSAGKAFQKFIGEALKGIAVQMAMESLKHGAYALGSLAFGDVRGAGQHGQAALMFGTGAALAAGAAKAFGGGAAPASTSAKAPNVSGGGGSGGGREPERIIVYSDPFAESTARERQLQSERMVARAYGNNAVVRE